jgi:acyl-CoA synthetase (AMP-forming)/AMP-acid ligase II
VAYNIADLFEHTVDAVPDRVAVIDRDTSLTFAELDARANRFAHFLADRGIGPGDHVGIYAMNSEAWVTAMLGTLKVRAVPINVNYRYVEDELAYIIANAGLVACVFDQEYTDRLSHVADRSPELHTFVHIEDDSGKDPSVLGSVAFSEAAASGSPERDFGERSGDDHYVIYTGGTTGMPKGVVWRSEDIYFALGQGIDAMTGERVASEYTKAEMAAASPTGLVFCVIPPLMHGAAQIATMSQWFIGTTIVLLPKFSAEAVWDLIDAHGVNSILITGDAIGRPLIEALEAEPDRWNTSSLLSISSSAALFSQSVKDRFLEFFPNLVITDSIGSTEGGFNGIAMSAKGEKIDGGGPTVDPGADVVILDDDMKVIEPGDERTGKLARSGNIPLGYHNDPVKTAETFIEVDGVRYAVAGDMARWTPEGKIVLLGRGTVSINSGGEKIYPEEVEQAIKGHPAVFDCLVVGVPDERWGQRVAAVVHFRDGHQASLQDLTDHAREHIAGYKVPRELHSVEAITRSPSGKPDYPWAKQLAESGTALVEGP